MIYIARLFKKNLPHINANLHFAVAASAPNTSKI